MNSISNYVQLIGNLGREVEFRDLDNGNAMARVSIATKEVFRDGDGHEGFNAVVRIDDRERLSVSHYLWLDRIASVTALGSA